MIGEQHGFLSCLENEKNNLILGKKSSLDEKKSGKKKKKKSGKKKLEREWKLIYKLAV